MFFGNPNQKRNAKKFLRADRDFHIQLKNEKIWIEEDWTEDGVATDFLLAGVLREDIVFAFHPPKLRQYTEFTIA